MPTIYEKLWAIGHALNLPTTLIEWYFTFNIYFKPIALRPGGNSSYSQVWWFFKSCNLFSIAFFHLLLWIASLMASLYIVDLWILITVLVIESINYWKVIWLVKMSASSWVSLEDLEPYLEMVELQASQALFLVFYKVLICLRLFIPFKMKKVVIW